MKYPSYGLGTRLLSIDSGQNKAVLKDVGRAAFWSPDGKLLAAAGNDMKTPLLFHADGRLARSWGSGKSEIARFAWSSDGRWLAATQSDKTIRFWEVTKEGASYQIGPYADLNTAGLCWLPNSSSLAFNDMKAGWQLWDVEQRKPVKEPKRWPYQTVVFAPDGLRMAVTDGPTSPVTLREIATGKELGKRRTGIGSRSTPIVWAPDGQLIALQEGRQIELWDPADFRRVRTLDGLCLPYVEANAWSPDGKVMAGFAEATVTIWETDTGRRRGVLVPGADGLTISADGHYRGGPQVERQIVMVVHKDDGSSEVLEPAEFERKYRWKNDPDRVHLLQPLPPPLVTPEGAPLSPLALVPRPAEVKGVRSWTVETVNPRGNTHALAMRPDGKQVAVSSADGIIRIWALESGHLVRMLNHGSNVVWLSWSPDGKMLVSSSHLSPGRIWDVQSGRLLRFLPPRVAATSWSPDSRMIAMVEGGYTLQLWDVARWKIVRTQRFPTVVGALERVAPVWSPDSHTLALPSDKAIRLWDVQKGKELRSLEGHTGEVLSISWSPDGKQLASSAKGDSNLRIWDAASGKGIYAFQFRNVTGNVAWSPDGKALAIGTQSPHSLYDPNTGKQIVRLSFSGGQNSYRVAWTSDARQVVVSGSDGTQVLDASNGQLLQTLGTGAGSIHAAEWSPDGHTLAVGQSIPKFPGGALSLFDLQSNRLRWPTIQDAGLVVAWSPDGKQIVAQHKAETLLLRNTLTGEELRTLEGNVVAGSVYTQALAWSPDGAKVAAGVGKRILVWSAETGKQIWRSEELPGKVSALAWSPDSGQLVSGTGEGPNAVCIWDGKTGQRLQQVVPNGPTSVKAVAWSPDGRTVAAGRNDDLFLIDAGNGQVRGKIAAGLYELSVLQWSSDGQRLSALVRGELRTWDVATGKLLRSVVTQHTPVSFSRDSRWLAHWKGPEVRLWDVANGRARGVLLPGEEYEQLAVGPEGHFTGSPRVERSVRIVLQKADGSSETLPIDEFERRYGWKNQPDQARVRD